MEELSTAVIISFSFAMIALIFAIIGLIFSRRVEKKIKEVNKRINTRNNGNFI